MRVLQPRVTPSLPVGDEGSLFQRVFSSTNGIDPYAAAVSDVYQDLFGEGSYAGKGIYDVDAFEAALADRVPDSTLLSHDLFEGVFARAGLASDIEVVENPSRPLRRRRAAPPSLGARRLAIAAVDLGLERASRQVPAPAGTMPAIGRWKMLDNLRRTLSALDLRAGVAGGLGAAVRRGVGVDALLPATIVLPSLSPVLASVGCPPSGHSRPRALRRRPCRDLGSALAQGLLIVDLPRAPGLADGRRDRANPVSAVRHPPPSPGMVPAAQATIGRGPSLGAYYRGMAGAVVIGVVAIGGDMLFGDRHCATWPRLSLLLWIASPAIARWVSRPSSAVAEHRSAARRQARRCG